MWLIDTHEDKWWKPRVSIWERKDALIEESFAAGGAAEAGDTVIAVPLTFELVVVSEFFVYISR